MPTLFSRLPMRGCIAAAVFAMVGMAVLGGQAACAAAPRTLLSPNGRLAVQIQMPQPGSVETPHWSATFRGKTILSDCRLSLEADRNAANLS